MKKVSERGRSLLRLLLTPGVHFRAIALVWAVWCVATALAYVDQTPETLARTEAMLHVPIWVAWASASVFLILGAIVPPSDREWVKRLGAMLRGIGMAISAGMLALWGLEFMTGDMDRGWVSGKNYLLLSMCALASSWYVGKVTEQSGDADVGD